MKRIFHFILFCCMTALSATAQEKKAFTLEDVIPGGENYFNLVPKSMPGLQWWGDVCVRTDVEAIQYGGIDSASARYSSGILNSSVASDVHAAGTKKGRTASILTNLFICHTNSFYINTASVIGHPVESQPEMLRIVSEFNTYCIPVFEDFRIGKR